MGPTTRKPIALALQGGGAHGAYTAGALDRLLEDGELAVEALSGASAGAVSAVAVAIGLARGGPPEAQRLLRAVWDRVSRLGALTLSVCPPFASIFEAISAVASPYQYNPIGFNPLRSILQDLDYKVLLAGNAPTVHVAATHVESGRARVFGNADLARHGMDVLLASACLPRAFHAVEIDGEHYWDGGYAANPSLMDLVRAGAGDVVLLRLTPALRAGVPRTAEDISARLGEIQVDSALLSEIRVLAALGMPDRRLRLHTLDGGTDLGLLSPRSKLIATPALIRKLWQSGCDAADRWLPRHTAQIGQRSTCLEYRRARDELRQLQPSAGAFCFEHRAVAAPP